ncbi:MAG: rhomboid family intramembrane serine protease [Paludibacteraceae bacterium]|nr:rhomboid family intramembrane serine protease [Paludibacteraceae bacterium]
MLNTENNWWTSIPPVTRNILAVNIIVFLTDMLFRRFGVDFPLWLGLNNWGYSAFNFSGIGSFHIWQPFTYMFLHSGFGHLFCNMFAVWMFAPVIEEEWGSRKFLTYYIVCGIGAALTQEIVWIFTNGAYPAITIGASGAVFGILLAFAWLFPEQKMFLLFVPIPISSRIFVGLYALLELVAGVASIQGDSIAHFAHLGGMIFGYALIKYWQHKSNHKNRFKVYDGKDFSNYHYKDPIK